jgi:hypothetical protein
MHLDDSLLDQFIHTFYGLGTYSGKYWFIGMEEGGGNSFDEVSNQVSIWQEFGKQELDDIAEFHFRINMAEYFTDPVKIQKTWGQLARIILSSQGKSATASDVKTYQRDMLGRKNSETCLLELLPLQSPNLSTWHYDQWSNLKILKSRATYTKFCLPWRCEYILSKILDYRPRVVVFYSYSYKELWKKIAGPDVHFTEEAGVRLGTAGNTLFLIIKHPALRGIRNTYFESVGSLIQPYLQGISV